ncbi:C39 family peptidase [Faecalibacillus faecis]|uniref:C39 family peptidase n=1 Tax=Faecalibacillus faecis TaxID=1982628 RepID=UPI003863DC41
MVVGPTSASMIVTATKGAITPDTMSDLFVRYGYRSANNGTYWSAFRAVADEFNIGYEETTDIQRALQLLESKRLVVASCGNGLFTTGGHFIVLTGIENGNIKIYDPYLYASKFETSTRRGKVSVSGNTVYCPISNFINYANAKGFFCYAYDGQVPTNDTKPVTTNTYTRYVKANGGLNVRNNPNGTRIGGLASGTKVTVSTTIGNWSQIVAPLNGWVCTDYLYSNNTVTTYANTYVNTRYTTGKYRVTASVLNVRYGAGTNYKAKTWRQLTANARSQNSRLGNYYTNGLRRGVITTVTKVIGEWGLTPSGYVNLRYCTKL